VRAGAFGTSDAAAPYVWRAYLDWHETQDDPANRRGPGTTCLSALGCGVMGTALKPVNDSKGCGTIMRIAPCALLYPDDPHHWASVCGAMTHGHDTGHVAGAAFAQILHRVLLGEALEAAIRATLGVLSEAGQEAHETRDVLRQVLDAHEDDVPLPVRIVQIGVEPLVARHGRGWVAEEALAIALSCALVHPNDFSAAVLSAVNITGDSDSTGSVTGALMGAMLGLDAIPPAWRERVEDSGMLAGLADELYGALRETCPHGSV
jgi:ADP-ribosylglycohydrolase